MAQQGSATAAEPLGTNPKPPVRPAPVNPALRMLGIPLPRKLPSRNWMIFWTISAAVTGAIIYDRREKRRATARWAHTVEHLAKEPLPGGNQSAMPRKLTIYLESPPGDGIRSAQEHFIEYVKPVLAASGLDWEFVQGRMQGDVRAAVAEKIRRLRRAHEDGYPAALDEEPTEEEIIQALRRKNSVPDYDGIRGDIIVGRHTWKEYVRGLHEGWLGPLAPPTPISSPEPTAAIQPSPTEAPTDNEQPQEEKPEGEKPEAKEPESKPKRPPQPVSYNTTDDYSSEHLPLLVPSEFAPSTAIPFPHLLGFLNTPTRMYRFFNKRKLADRIGREVAAVCLSTYREYDQGFDSSSDAPVQFEQQKVLEPEEKDWIKTVWQDDPKATEEQGEAAAQPPKEKIWPRPIVMDPRIATRMRRFELLPEDEDRARRIVVDEKEIEGWIKGGLRSLANWALNGFSDKKPQPVPVLESED